MSWRNTPRQTRETLLARVNRLPSGCWEWTGFINQQGYGACCYRGRRGFLAHRVFYIEFIGPIRQGMSLDHVCHSNDPSCPPSRNCPHRRCVNPEHLEPVTAEVNTARAGQARKTHCPLGHPYDSSNTVVKDGRRFCLACRRKRNQEQSALRSEARRARRMGVAR